MIYYVECGISGVKIGEYDSAKFTFQEVVSIARREIRFPEPFGCRIFSPSMLLVWFAIIASVKEISTENRKILLDSANVGK
jgi:hypothetical protein